MIDVDSKNRRIFERSNNHPNRSHYSHCANNTGSVMLAILGMAAVSSIAILTTMQTIKSLTKTIAIETLQINANQVLSEKHNEIVDNYQITPIANDSTIATPIKFKGLDYSYHLHPTVVGVLNLPPIGYSINSNFSTKLVRLTSQTMTDLVKTPLLISGLSCLQARSDELPNNGSMRYQLDDYFINPVSYLFNSDTGMIWKTTSADTQAFMDMNFELLDKFNRVDYAMTGSEYSTKFVMAFAVTQPQNKNTDAKNNLYIVFDELITNETTLTQLTTKDLTELNTNHVATGNEKGYLLPLSSGQLHVSAITTIQHQIIFITQRLSLDQQTSSPAYENYLYQVNLLSTNNPILTITRLADSAYILNLATHQTDLTQISLQTQTDSELVSFDLHCNRVFQYEQ